MFWYINPFDKFNFYNIDFNIKYLYKSIYLYETKETLEDNTIKELNLISYKPFIFILPYTLLKDKVNIIYLPIRDIIDIITIKISIHCNIKINIKSEDLDKNNILLKAYYNDILYYDKPELLDIINREIKDLLDIINE